MDLFIDGTQPVAVEIGATGIRQLAQEIRMVLATCRGSVPLDRDFGISWDMIDRSLPAARQMLVAEVAQQLERNVPRITFKSIRFPDPGKENTEDGTLPFSVTVSIREEFEHEFVDDES